MKRRDKTTRYRPATQRPDEYMEGGLFPEVVTKVCRFWGGS